MKIVHTYPAVTEWFFTTLRDLLEKQGIVTIGLAGGTSFDHWYADILLSSWEGIDMSRIRWCVTDERVNCDIADRNDEHIWQSFLKPLSEMGLSKDEYFIRPEMQDDGAKYTKKILQVQTPLNPPLSGGHDTELSTFYFSHSTLLDIAFFGIGPDGHTASIFPHSGEISEYLETPLNPPLSGGQYVEFIKIENAPKPPPERISLSPRSIQLLEHVCLFAVGESKKEALANFLDDSVSVDDCPAKLLKPEIVFDATSNGNSSSGTCFRI